MGQARMDVYLLVFLPGRPRAGPLQNFQGFLGSSAVAAGSPVRVTRSQVKAQGPLISRARVLPDPGCRGGRRGLGAAATLGPESAFQTESSAQRPRRLHSSRRPARFESESLHGHPPQQGTLEISVYGIVVFFLSSDFQLK